MKLVIVAEEHNELGIGELDQAIEVRSPADGAVQRSIDDPRVAKGGDDPGGVVVRRVVGHHQGEIAITLPQDACYRPAQQARPVPSRNSDRDADAFSIRRRVQASGHRSWGLWTSASRSPEDGVFESSTRRSQASRQNG
jgi:hypothetical protein